jgi:hypothetical protein
MHYEKPEVAILGEAINLIQGGKHTLHDPGAPLGKALVADCELDD